MWHVVLLKFNSKELNSIIFDDICLTYAKIKEQVHGINEVIIKKNIQNIETNSNIMILIRYENKESLISYLSHPLHSDIKMKYQPLILEKSSIDID